MIFFLDRVSLTKFLAFRTHVVATTVCTTGGVHTLTCCTHSFCYTVCLRTSAYLHACAHTCMAQGCQKVLCTCVISLHLAFSSLMFHPSLLFFDGHIETTPDFEVHTFLPYLPVPKAQGMRISARAARSLAIWPSPPSTQVMRPKSSTRSLLWTVTRCSFTIQTSMKSLTSRKTHTRTKDCSVGVLTMFESSFSHVSHGDFALQIESKESMHLETDC